MDIQLTADTYMDEELEVQDVCVVATMDDGTVIIDQKILNQIQVRSFVYISFLLCPWWV